METLLVGLVAASALFVLPSASAKDFQPGDLRVCNSTRCVSIVEVGIPVADEVPGEGRIAAGQLPGGAAINTWHYGSHDRLGEAYKRLEAWLEEHDRAPAGAAWEVYWWIDPTAEPDPATWPPPDEWRAELVQPLVDTAP